MSAPSRVDRVPISANPVVVAVALGLLNPLSLEDEPTAELEDSTQEPS